MYRSFDVFRELAVMYSQGIHIADVIELLGIKKIYIYGVGDIGKIVLSDLSNSGIVLRAYDKNNTLSSIDKMHLTDVPIAYPDSIPSDDVPILITPINHFAEIADFLTRKHSVERHRILSIKVLLKYARYYLIEKKEKPQSIPVKEFLITGANFDNKGSQAMTFVVMDQLRKRYKDVVIWFCPNFYDEVYDEKPFKLIGVFDGCDVKSTVNEVIARVDAVFDVGGYAITSIPGFGATERTMNYLKMAYYWNTPFFLMPQSFGPLDYPPYKLAEMRELLSVCKMVFTRETNGEQLLRDMGLNNTYRSSDMVLQADDVNVENIYCETIERALILSGDNRVALIPNTNLGIYQDDTVNIYTFIVKTLIKLDKKVAIIPHSGDEYLCERIIKELNENEICIEYINDYYDCIDFSVLVESFDFIVASRYHAIVHAYKKSVPCVIVGWADKYHDIVNAFDQSSYLVDVREKWDMNDISIIINKMEEKCKEESRMIKRRLKAKKDASCFELVFKELGHLI